MQKKSFQILSLSILLILGIVFLTTLVAAETPKEVLWDPIKSMFADWDKGNLTPNIAKYIIWLLLTLVIYSILEFFPTLKGKEGLKFLIALIVAFLGTALFTPSDVYTILASYTALGFTLSALLPFVILLFFSIQVTREGKLAGKMFSKIMWLGFIGFLIYKIIYGMYYSEIVAGTNAITLSEGWSYIGFILLSIIWLFFGDRVFTKWFFKEETATAKEIYKTRVKKSNAFVKTNAGALEDNIGDD